MSPQPEARLAAVVVATGALQGTVDALALVPWSAGTLIEHTIARMAEWPVEAVVVVLGQGAEDVLDGCDLGDALVVIDTDWTDGETSSLRVGLDVIMRESVADAALLVPVDQPFVDDEVVERLIVDYRSLRSRAVVPRYRYVRGWPMVIGADLWQRVMTMSDDETIENLLQAHPAWVHEVVVDAPPPRRIRTSDDLIDIRPRH